MCRRPGEDCRSASVFMRKSDIDAVDAGAAAVDVDGSAIDGSVINRRR